MKTGLLRDMIMEVTTIIIITTTITASINTIMQPLKQH
jgi:hypothetical protein